MLETVSLPSQKIQGADSWILNSRRVEAALTHIGGMLGPVTFKLTGKQITPFSVAPWAEETLDAKTPALLKALRGDFFCAPFGGNERPLGQEQFPPHGEPANGNWQFVSAASGSKELVAEFSFKTTIRPGEVRKQVRLLHAHTCIYQRHTLSGFSGALPIGHHAMLKFPDAPLSGLISTCPFDWGQVFPGAFENAAIGGYQALKPGATFKSLNQVPMIDGQMADLSHYPARPGFEDLAMVVASGKSRLGWNAVSFPREGYVWFSLKDTRVLRNTVFWISNGGRHYSPWSGRHTHILGIEDVTANFHYGANESVNPNPLSKQGMPTAIELSPTTPTVVNYITGVVAIPHGFERVIDIKPAADKKSITLYSSTGQEIQAEVDLDWLQM